MHQRLHRLEVVVHALHQHGLAAERDAGVREPPAGLFHLGRDLGRVREVQAHPYRPVAFQDARQLARDAHRLHHWLLAADAHEFHVRNPAQPAEHEVQPVVVQAQRVAAGDQYVADFRMAFDVAERGLDVVLADGALADRADHTGARAVAAVDRAEIGHEQQHPVGVAVHQARHRAVPVFTQRIVSLARRGLELAEGGHHGAAQRLQRVVGVEQARVVRRDAHRQAALVAPYRLGFLVGQAHDARQVVQGSNALAVLPAPVVPIVGAGFRVMGFQERL